MEVCAVGGMTNGKVTARILAKSLHALLGAQCGRHLPEKTK